MVRETIRVKHGHFDLVLDDLVIEFDIEKEEEYEDEKLNGWNINAWIKTKRDWQICTGNAMKGQKLKTFNNWLKNGKEIIGNEA